MGFLQIMLGALLGVIGLCIMVLGSFGAIFIMATNFILGLVIGLVCLVLGLTLGVYAKRMIAKG
jgi:drug/metabolite transporter (DMT)-like permease